MFVSKFNVFGLGLPLIPAPSLSMSAPFSPPKPAPGGANPTFTEGQKDCLVYPAHHCPDEPCVVDN